MATKRFQPSLIVIPEEHQITLSDTRNTLDDSQANSITSVKDGETRKKSCVGCPGCSSDKEPSTNNAGCKNCGDKRNSIRKWLEGVSKHEGDHVLSDHETDASATAKGQNGVDAQRPDNAIGAIKKPPGIRELLNKISDSSSSSDSDTIKANSIGSKNSKKKKPPPLPSTAPKIISHCLKREVPNKMLDKAPPITNNSGMTVKNNINNNSIYVKSHSFNHQAAIMLDKGDIYNNLSIGGSEIYNNPQFNLNSPPVSMRSRNSKQTRASRKHMEVMDQYANPMLLRQQNTLQNIQKMPDMVYEALTNDYTQRNASGPYGQINRLVPTPDYDDPRSTLSSIKQRYANVNEDPFHVPTPDYNTPVRNKNGKLYQPDSPIYHRKSPHYLIVDYETDSLERSHVRKMSRNSLTPHSNNSSDIGSQPSPSLSSALPLEEEMEVRNTVYDRIEGFRKDGDPDKTISKQVISNMSIYEEVRSMSSTREPRIRYNTPFHGSMTIEVEHSPTDTEVSTDSDQFEPDTLDRKPKKLNNATQIVKPNCTSIPNNLKQVNAWNNHLQKSADFLNQVDSSVRYSSLENMTSLPDMKIMNNNNENQVVLRSSGSFKSNSLGTYYSEIGAIMNNNLDKNFCSLREIYEAKNQKNLQVSPTLSELDFEESGRLLTLEARHSKRQRQITLEKKKKTLPPDVIPLKGSVDRTQPPDDATKSKNFKGWNTDEVNDKICNSNTNNNKLNYERHQPSSDSTSSNSSNSESTDVTGVSETHLNLEHDSVRRPYSQVHKKSPLTKLKQDAKLVDISENNYCNLSDVRSSSSQQEQSDCNSESSTIKSSSTKFYYKTNLFQHAKNNNALKQIDDTDKIEILSSKPIAHNNDRPILMDETANDLIKELASDTTSFSPNLALNSTKVFHVDVNTATNGMQIALGLKDRVKKSKDLKNAWKKFVNMATSKFQGTIPKSGSKTEFDSADRASSLSDVVDRDDGIASLNACDENGNICPISSSNLAQVLSRTSSTSSSDITNRQSRNEMDYGYISADSNESRANNKKLYERFNFKANKTNTTSSSGSDANEHDTSQKNMMRMQEIKEMSESERSSLPSVKDESKNSTSKSRRDAPKLVDFIPKNIMLNVSDAVDVNVYSSSDDERYSHSSSMSSDEEGHLELDEMCESGAESVETNSVFFKKIRKVPNGN